MKPSDKADAKEAAVKAEWRGMGTSACVALQGKKLSAAAVLYTQAACKDQHCLGSFANAFSNANYEYRFMKAAEPAKEGEDPRSKKKTRIIEDLEMLDEKDVLTSEIPFFYLACSQSTNLAKNIANYRGSYGTPDKIHEDITQMVAKGKNIKEYRVLDAKLIQENGMELIWNVGKGATCKPKVVMVHYQGDPSRDEVDLALVGKGVTFDTGGLNVKGTGNMEDMYGDKGGAAGVLGALHGTMMTGLKKNIVFSVGLAENAIGSECFKPSDILTSMNGLTVEIGNTDAEGRLVMADVMTYVQNNFKPKRIINIATLTGAAMIAVGTSTGCLFSNDDTLKDQVLAAAKESTEPMWHLPVNDEHRASIKPEAADLKNLGRTPYGGSCTAAAFLEAFVDEGVKWAHLDIAGPGILRGGPKPPGALDNTGFGASLLLHLIKISDW
jgi:leucyl aminopeptidase